MMRDVDGMPEPGWTAVEHRKRALESWTDERLVLDSVDPVARNVHVALEYLRR